MYEAENEHIMSPLKFSISKDWSSLNDLVFSLNRRVERNRLIDISYNRSLVLIVEKYSFLLHVFYLYSPTAKKAWEYFSYKTRVDDSDSIETLGNWEHS